MSEWRDDEIKNKAAEIQKELEEALYHYHQIWGRMQWVSWLAGVMIVDSVNVDRAKSRELKKVINKMNELLTLLELHIKEASRRI